MNQKTTGTLYMIIGAIGIIGSIVAILMLILMAGSAGFLYVPDTDPDYAQLRNAGDTLVGFAVLGIVWVICIIITSIVTILSGVRKIRK